MSSQYEDLLMDSISTPVSFGQFTEIVPSETSSITVGQGAFSKIFVIVIMHFAMTPLLVFGVAKSFRTSCFFLQDKNHANVAVGEWASPYCFQPNNITQHFHDLPGNNIEKRRPASFKQMPTKLTVFWGL